MYILEITSLLLIIGLCFLSSKSDFNCGLIRNKLLFPFIITGIVINIVYYGCFVRDLFLEYLLNLVVVSIISLYLFYSHSFAGGDCKFTIVLAMLYPARFYLVYGTTNITLFLAIGFAIFIGYCYLVIDSLWSIITNKVKVTWKYIISSVTAFLKSYVVATLYIFILNIGLSFLYNFGIEINQWISTALCMILAWCIGKFNFFKKIFSIVIVVICTITLSILLKSLPFSINPSNYVLVFVLLFCQMAIKTIIYEDIDVKDLKKGMILSSISSVIMQSSITKGLPQVSTEDLRSRLTESEVESVKIWAKATRTQSLSIVKKIPFAIFISIGFIAYLILWGILSI